MPLSWKCLGDRVEFNREGQWRCGVKGDMKKYQLTE